MPTWPASLPQHFLLNSYESTRSKAVIRTEMDAGPPSARRRFTATTRPFSGEMVMTRAQRNAFWEFFDGEAGAGASSIDFPAQDGSADTWTCRFAAEPTERWLTATDWLVSMQLEVMPGGVTPAPGGGEGTYFESGYFEAGYFE